MICDNSSSSAKPDSEFILNGAKESIIGKVDPSGLHANLEDGIQIKEDLIDNITHESLYANDNFNYDELEGVVSRTLGDDYTKFLLGKMDISDLTKPQIPPDIKYVGDDNMINVKICGLNMAPMIKQGTIPVDGFTFYWNIVIAPQYGVVTYSNRNSISPHISFSKTGSYTLRMTYKYERLSFMTSVVFNVLPMDKNQ